MDQDANNPAEQELAPDEQSSNPADEPQPDTDQADDDGPADEAEPEFEEVEVDGERLNVPKSAAEKLRAAMLRQADYTRKTQELAQQREQLERMQGDTKAQIETERAQVQSVARMLAIDERLQQYQNTDWQAMSQSDPVTAQQKFFEYTQLKDQRAALVDQVRHAEAQRALKQQQETAGRLQQAQEVLTREIKGWSPNLAKELRSVAKSLGAEDRDIDGINAPWIVRALHAQKLLSEMTAKAAKAPAPAPAVPVQTITGARDVARKDPDKMSIDEWMATERRRAAKLGRRF